MRGIDRDRALDGNQYFSSRVNGFPNFQPNLFQFEFECRAHGADILAYPPVVAGGNRANTLHYVKNNQLIKVTKWVLTLLPEAYLYYYVSMKLQNYLEMSVINDACCVVQPALT